MKKTSFASLCALLFCAVAFSPNTTLAVEPAGFCMTQIVCDDTVLACSGTTSCSNGDDYVKCDGVKTKCSSIYES